MGRKLKEILFLLYLSGAVERLWQPKKLQRLSLIAWAMLIQADLRYWVGMGLGFRTDDSV